ncbi:MAG TPA: L-seryl-tRNA(Sec) selenium transferase [Dehalococcoidales bacterium]|nr:L-seryl-tRNA(Sec) selenium transferase [Dehalococcoidales bacterium]
MNMELRKLPSVDLLLNHPQIKELSDSFPHEFVVNLVRRQIEDVRNSILDGKTCPDVSEIIGKITAHARSFTTGGIKRVVNATGVVLHTNLGRAPLSKEAITAMQLAASGYNNLEFDIESGSRGSRQVHIESLLCEVTGAEAGLVVNNNASAVLLGLSALAKRKEIIVSRGQAVEIGDSFRIPDVMRQSGAKLVEVGTTNCTYARDYENAVTPATAAIMRVHSSNFKVIGFTNQVDIAEMAAVAEKSGLPVFDDQGSGCLLDTTAYGLSEEPLVQKSVSAGAALVFFSGDKLIGGPQAGIIVGKRTYVDKLRRHPLARAVRIDKIRLAGLAATLLHYLKGEAVEKVPVWQMISATTASFEPRLVQWVNAAGDSRARIISGESMVGGGSLPGGTLPTRLLAIGDGNKKSASSIQKLADSLRRRDMPVIGRIQDNVLLLDPRTVMPEEDEIVAAALQEIKDS